MLRLRIERIRKMVLDYSTTPSRGNSNSRRWAFEPLWKSFGGASGRSGPSRSDLRAEFNRCRRTIEADTVALSSAMVKFPGKRPGCLPHGSHKERPHHHLHDQEAGGALCLKSQTTVSGWNRRQRTTCSPCFSPRRDPRHGNRPVCFQSRHHPASRAYLGGIRNSAKGPASRWRSRQADIESTIHRIIRRIRRGMF